MHLQSMANQSQQRGAWADNKNNSKFKSKYHNSMQFDMGSTDRQNIIIQDSLYAEQPGEQQLTISCGEELILSDENKNMLSEKFFKMGDSDESIK